jgi:hypothetical protein
MFNCKSASVDFHNEAEIQSTVARANEIVGLAWHSSEEHGVTFRECLDAHLATAEPPLPVCEFDELALAEFGEGLLLVLRSGHAMFQELDDQGNGLDRVAWQVINMDRFHAVQSFQPEHN